MFTVLSIANDQLKTQICDYRCLTIYCIRFLLAGILGTRFALELLLKISLDHKTVNKRPSSTSFFTLSIIPASSLYIYCIFFPSFTLPGLLFLSFPFPSFLFSSLHRFVPLLHHLSFLPFLPSKQTSLRLHVLFQPLFFRRIAKGLFFLVQ